MCPDNVTAAVHYIEQHAPLRAWMVGRKYVADIASLACLEMNLSPREISKEELVRRVAPRLRRKYGSVRLAFLSRFVFLVYDWHSVTSR